MQQAPIVAYRKWTEANPTRDGVRFFSHGHSFAFHTFSKEIITDSAFVYRLVLFVFAVLGIVVSPFFFSIHLLDVVSRSKVIQSVLTAVMIKAKNLILTGVLGVVVYMLIQNNNVPRFLLVCF